MYGYAVRAADTAGAPTRLRAIGTVAAGEEPTAAYTTDRMLTAGGRDGASTRPHRRAIPGISLWAAGRGDMRGYVPTRPFRQLGERCAQADSAVTSR